jgi:alkylation response protein AidB-like acyl-CoA dehydrogenase
VDPTYPPQAEEYREKIRAFLAEHLPADWQGIGALEDEARDDFVRHWRDVLADNRLLAMSWPARYGGAGLTPIETVIVHEEFTKAGVPTGSSNDGFGITMVGNTLLVWGTEAQKDRFLPAILSGQDVWCQGYSEPNSGSDLASLGTRAVLDGDEWVINGQKIWTSGARDANWIFVLCRTDPEAAKHQGISFLLCPMDQPGVEVRPIRNIAGHSHFNEVFFTDARTAVDNVVGEVNQGWAVANTLLGFERGAGASTTSIRFRVELDRLVDLARERGRLADPLLRQRLAWCHSKVEIMRYLGMSALTSFLGGENPGPASSIGKLNWSEYHRRVTELAIDVLGAEATLITGDERGTTLSTADPGSPNNAATWESVFLHARAGTIYAGTSQVQRNIIGERILGLPKEPRADTGPWKDLPR